MIKVFRFLAMCTISVAFATIASAQAYTSIDFPGAGATSANGVQVPLPGGVARTGSFASPSLRVGPLAIPTAATAAGANYGLFGCQIPSFQPPTCYDPYQIRHAYNIDALLKAGFDGSGKDDRHRRRIPVPEHCAGAEYLHRLLRSAQFERAWWLVQSQPRHVHSDCPGRPDCVCTRLIPTRTAWAVEITLDVLWAHAIAPGANIVLVLAKSDADADLQSAQKYAIDNHLGDVISQSFGENESCMESMLLAQQHQLFANATMDNITIFASAGDNGAAQLTCDGSSLVQAVSTPASDPLVTAVGGTELHAAGYCLMVLGCDPAANPLPGTYEGEIAWNEVPLALEPPVADSVFCTTSRRTRKGLYMAASSGECLTCRTTPLCYMVC